MTRRRIPPSTSLARTLRRNMTDVELLLWANLRRAETPCQYRRQHPLGRFVADFACLRHRLVVECDGSQHHQSAHDQDRDRWLARRGFTVLRLTNDEILTDLESCLDTIIARCRQSSP